MAPKAAPKAAAAPAKPAAAATKSTFCTAGKCDKQSICCRPVDFLIAFAYLLFVVVQLVVLSVRCTEIAPTQLQAVCPTFAKLQQPFGIAVDTYKDWSNKVLTAKTSFALNLASGVNAFLLAPLALILAISFIKGCNCAKNLALLHSAALLYSMAVVYITGQEALEQHAGSIKGGDINTFFKIVVGFGLYFPFAVIVRVWRDAPFTKPAAGSGCFLGCTFKCLVKLGFVVWFLLATVAFYEFAVKNTKTAQHLPSAADTWAEIEPTVTQYTAGATEAASKAYDTVSEQASQLAAQVNEAASNLFKSDDDKKKH
jgi:hypothetical protein